MSARIKSSVGDNFPASFAVPRIFDFSLLDMSVDISHNVHGCQARADGEPNAHFILRKWGGPRFPLFCAPLLKSAHNPGNRTSHTPYMERHDVQERSS